MCTENKINILRDLGGRDLIDFTDPMIMDTNQLRAISSRGSGHKGQLLIQQCELFILLVLFVVFDFFLFAGSRNSITVISIACQFLQRPL